MKKAILLYLLTIPFLMNAQDEGYCPCQDEEKQIDEITQLINELNGQLTIYVPQNTVPVAIPVSMPKPPQPPLLRINVKPKKEEPVKPDQPLEEKEALEPMEQEAEIDSTPQLRTGASKRSKIKKSRKKAKFKLKRKRKARKYKGKCPAF